MTGANSSNESDENVQLSCPDCGAECWGAEDVITTVTVEEDTFGGKPRERVLAGKACPDCGREFAL